MKNERAKMPTALEDLLKDKKVKKEIERYKWIESEKIGSDIGLENATRNWLLHYGEAWLKEHPDQKKRTATRSRL
jgi:hypothetical protein